MGDGQFVDEAAGQLRGPAAIDQPVGGEGDPGVLLGAGDADIGQAAFLLEALLALFVDAALAGEDAFLPAGQEDQRELQPLGAVQGHDLDRPVAVRVLGRRPLQVHDQGDMLQIGLQRLELLHGLGQFLQVLQPRLAAGAVGLLHVGVAALLQHCLHHLPVRRGLGQGAPAVQVAHEVGQGGAGAGLKLVGVDQAAHGRQGGEVVLPGDLQNLLHAGVADAALRHIDDPLEGQVVVLGLDQAQIGVGVADFGPFEEAGAADDLVGDGQHDQPFLEGPHLEGGADQDGHVLVFQARLAGVGATRGLDLVGDQTRLGLAVPDSAHPHLVAAVVLGP